MFYEHRINDQIKYGKMSFKTGIFATFNKQNMVKRALTDIVLYKQLETYYLVIVMYIYILQSWDIRHGKL